MKILEEIDLDDNELSTPHSDSMNQISVIKSGVNSRLDQRRKEKKDADDYIKRIAAREAELTGLRLKLERSKTQGFYIEVSKSQIKNIPYRFKRIQTLASCERFKTDMLSEAEEKILSAENEISALETAIFDKLTKILRSYGEKIVKSARAVGELDCLMSLASAAKMFDYVRPKMLQTNRINIIDGRHPMVERNPDSIFCDTSNWISDEKNGGFVPNDTLLDSDENKMMLITGPNMSGKSVYMRQVALIVIMAHIGSFVPAKSAEICIIDQIFTRIGAADDISNGRSTFMVEMAEVAEILNSASARSLILLDEIGRGTSTYDGLSIAWAVLESLSKDFDAKVLFSTHYHELTKLEGVLKGLKNYKMATKESENAIIFSRKLVKGVAEKSFGIEAALLAGIRKTIIDRAREIMPKLESALIS